MILLVKSLLTLSYLINKVIIKMMTAWLKTIMLFNKFVTNKKVKDKFKGDNYERSFKVD